MSAAASLKRWFIAPYVMLNALGFVHALVHVVIGATGAGGDVAGWALAAAASATVLALRATVVAPSPQQPRRPDRAHRRDHRSRSSRCCPRRSRPSRRRLCSPTEARSSTPPGTAASGRRPSPALLPRGAAARLQLQALDGSDYSTGRLRGAPAALFFVRGSWCPFCMAQIRGVVRDYERLARRGVNVVMISPQPATESVKTAKRFGVDVLWLRDPDLRAAQVLGIVDRGGVPAGARGFGVDTVLPTLVVLDADGRILACDETDSYRVCPEPQTIIDVLHGVAADDPYPPVAPPARSGPVSRAG